MSIFKKYEFYSKHKPLYRKISESDIFALVSIKSKAEEKTDTLFWTCGPTLIIIIKTHFIEPLGRIVVGQLPNNTCWQCYTILVFCLRSPWQSARRSFTNFTLPINTRLLSFHRSNIVKCLPSNVITRNT